LYQGEDDAQAAADKVDRTCGSESRGGGASCSSACESVNIVSDDTLKSRCNDFDPHFIRSLTCSLALVA